MDISLVITIHDRIELYDLMMFYERKNVAPVITMLGRGTATENQLSALGLEPMQKALIAGVISGKEIPGFFKEAKKEFMIDVPGNGIMMTVPLKSVTGGRTLAYMTNQREMNKEMPKMEFNYELIVIIANSGHIDDVMDVARTAGADGGTVIHAKGTGAKFSDRFFGVSLADEKEVIFIAETKTKKAAIMKAVAEQMGPATPAGAICFTLPVSETGEYPTDVFVCTKTPHTHAEHVLTPLRAPACCKRVKNPVDTGFFTPYVSIFFLHFLHLSLRDHAQDFSGLRL